MEPVVSLKRASSVDYSLCIFCQSHKNKVLTSTASDHGLSIVKAVACARSKLRDSKNIQAIVRLENVLNSGAPATLVWHKLCYAHFTDKSKIERLQVIQAQYSKGKQDAVAFMLKLGTALHCRKGILLASHLDYNVAIRLAGVIYLIAAEAKCHLNCLRRFTRSTSKTKQVSSDTGIALIWLCKEIHQAAYKGHVILLGDAWERYKELAGESSTRLQQSFFSRSTTFKEMLQSQLGNLFTFFQPLDRSPSEHKIMLIPTKYQPLVVLQMKDDTTEDTVEVLRLPKYEHEDNIILSLIHAALKIRGDLIATPDHQCYSVRSINYNSDVNEEEHIRRKVLCETQDIFYGVSGGKKCTPKCAGLASTLHQATRSKDLVPLFNRAGHCLRYEQVLELETLLAESTFNTSNQTNNWCDEQIYPLHIHSMGKILFMQPNWLLGNGA
ncbi:hypothetical protein PR048_028869 [Dryococelus australis]|uniref:Uncharacterized protein n=1 Tax=Dryococelus australis TaxID=614101 RepID=A0ABQ9GBR4_9NEOP|nr:hypothetical protein PR048_028869 [Dryococelus australis]